MPGGYVIACCRGCGDCLMIHRLRTWLLIAAMAALIVGPAAIAAADRLIDRALQANTPLPARPTPQLFQLGATPECVPPIDQASYDALDHIRLGSDIDQAASPHLLALFAADQAARRLPANVVPQDINVEDSQRRLNVLGFLHSSQALSARDFVYSAYIFQHGDCPEHFLFANKLAQLALNANDPEARWIYAATLDRYLMSLGKLQKFGTQYTLVGSELVLYPVDPATTDEERAQYNVPALSDISNVKPSRPGPGATSRQWLETWWLTLIGASYAVLSATIAIFDPRPNAPLGVTALVVALLVYIVSLIGHYLQASALIRGAYQEQQNIWAIVNGVAIGAWLISAGLEIFHIRRVNDA